MVNNFLLVSILPTFILKIPPLFFLAGSCSLFWLRSTSSDLLVTASCSECVGAPRTWTIPSLWFPRCKFN